MSANLGWSTDRTAIPGCVFLLPLLDGRLELDFDDVCFVASSVYLEDELSLSASGLSDPYSLPTYALLDIAVSFVTTLRRVVLETGCGGEAWVGVVSANFCLLDP